MDTLAAAVRARTPSVWSGHTHHVATRFQCKLSRLHLCTATWQDAGRPHVRQHAPMDPQTLQASQRRRSRQAGPLSEPTPAPPDARARARARARSS